MEIFSEFYCILINVHVHIIHICITRDCDKKCEILGAIDNARYYNNNLFFILTHSVKKKCGFFMNNMDYPPCFILQRIKPKKKGEKKIGTKEKKENEYIFIHFLFLFFF